MKTLSREELKALAARRRELCFSFYLNTSKAGIETLENPVRFQRLLREAHERLLNSGVKSTQADKMLAPALSLLDDYPFWQQQDEGLAVFLSDGVQQNYKIPYPVQSQAFDGANFHLKPLLPLFAYDDHYFILALSKNSVRLFRATHYTIEQVALKSDVPQSESEALKYENPEKSLQVHAGKPGSRGEQTAIVHGQGANKEDTKERTLRYFHRVDHGLHDYLKDQRAPLLLACVDYYLPIYREANTYPHLKDAVIPGNPDETTPEQLREAGWKIIEPMVHQSRVQAAAAIEAGLAKSLATDDVEQAVLAASQGRVDKCLVALDTFCWGAVDPENNRVERLTREDPRSQDLLDYAAVQTVLQGGEVFPVPSESDIPGGGSLAVLYRF